MYGNHFLSFVLKGLTLYIYLSDIDANLLIISFSLESNAVDDSLPWDATLTLGSVSTTVKVFKQNNLFFI